METVCGELRVKLKLFVSLKLGEVLPTVAPLYKATEPKAVDRAARDGSPLLPAATMQYIEEFCWISE